MKKTISIFVILCFLVSLVSCGKNQELSFEEMTVEQKVEYLLSEMTLEEKIAQMMIVYYAGNEADDTLVEIISNVKPGGFILFGNNISTYEKTKNFVDILQKNSEIPMIISMDQEGGTVQRMLSLSEPEATNIPSMYDLGATEDQALAYDVGKVMAEEMRTIGVNVVFGPVVDIYSNENNTVIGTRSFGRSSELVSKMATSLARGMEDNGVIATYKHFPGHGDTAVDSHVALPIINKSLEELENEELVPFKAAIENDAKIVMIGHIAVPEITGDDTPASLSKAVVTDLLKDKMGFDGLVVTDALNMGALTGNYTTDEIYKMAIEAGVDLLLMPSGSKAAIESIKKWVSEERIDESVRKILTFKYTYLENYSSLDSSYLGSSAHKEIIAEIPR